METRAKTDRLCSAIILRFPNECHAGTASVRPRAASLVSAAAVNPAAFAVDEAKTGSHHSAGIRSRVNHLRARKTPAPTSTPIASGEAHKPMTSLNVAGSNIESPIRQIVLNLKDNVSTDCERQIGLNLGVAKADQAISKYLTAFLDRTRLAREAAGYTQQQVADLLGIDQPKYAKYEVRSYLPHYLVHKFCLACRIQEEWLFSGAGRAPGMVKMPQEPPKKSAKPARKGRKVA